MPKKFILKDKLGKVKEVVEVKSIAALNKMFTEEHIALGEVTEKDCQEGQIYDKAKKKFVDFVESAEVTEKRSKSLAQSEIKKLEREAISELIKSSNNAKVKSIVAKIEIEKGKI